MNSIKGFPSKLSQNPAWISHIFVVFTLYFHLYCSSELTYKYLLVMSYLIDVLGPGHQGRGRPGGGHQPHPLTLPPQVDRVNSDCERLLGLQPLHLEQGDV